MCVGREILLKIVLIFSQAPISKYISNEIMSGANRAVLSSFYNVKITKGFISLKTCVYFMCVSVSPTLCKVHHMCAVPLGVRRR